MKNTEFNEIVSEKELSPLPHMSEPEPEPEAFSSLLQNIFPDGTIEYDGKIGKPSEFPLTPAELAEVTNPS